MPTKWDAVYPPILQTNMAPDIVHWVEPLWNIFAAQRQELPWKPLRKVTMEVVCADAGAELEVLQAHNVGNRTKRQVREGRVFILAWVIAPPSPSYPLKFKSCSPTFFVRGARRSFSGQGFLMPCRGPFGGLVALEIQRLKGSGLEAWCADLGAPWTDFGSPGERRIASGRKSGRP